MFYRKFTVTFIIFTLSLLLSVKNIQAHRKPFDHNKKSYTFSAEQDEPLTGLQFYINEIMKKLPVVPGLAVAVVKGDQVIFAQGFGYRNIKLKLPVTPQTLFYIASATKSFNATTAKLLAEEGKLDLDAPIRTYFPNLNLPAPLSADQISLRDLLVHRSGISNDPVSFRTAYSGQSNKNEMMKLLNTSTTPISPSFKYTNLGYIIAGYAMENAAKESWQQLVQRKILDPLDMNSTTFYASKVKANSDYAIPYLGENGTFTEIPYKEDNQMHAAGGMATNVEDLAKWLIVNINGGRYNGKQIISTTALDELHFPQINQKVTFYKFKRYGYSLAWDVANYDGDKMLHRFGSYPGFRPHVSFMPDRKFGVIVLANESESGIFLPDLIASDIYDYLLRKKLFRVDGNPKAEEYAAAIQKNKKRAADKAAIREQEREKETTPTLNLEQYSGLYENAEYGRMEIIFKNNSLLVKLGNLSGVAKYYSRDSFEVMLLPGNADKLNFIINQNKALTGLDAEVIGEKISFTKIQ